VIDLWDCSPEQLKECRLLAIAIQLNIGACYMKLRQWTDAVDTLKYVLDRDPGNVKAFYRLGQVYMEQMEYDQGIEIIKSGLKVRQNKKRGVWIIYINALT
jgi:tetratricopeptide (TPR) repeat protein